MSSSWRTRAALFASVAASVITLALTAPTASAAPSTVPVAATQPAAASANACPANTFCLFQNANFTGNVYEFPVNSGRVCDFKSLGHGLVNSASSMINNSSHLVRLYADEGNCTGTRYDAKPNSVDSTFANNNFNDRASGLSFS